MHLSPIQRPAAKVPSAETVEKWAKGAVDPRLLTFEDRQKLLRRHPYAESNAFCEKLTGMDFDALIEKAARTDDLTYPEAWLVSKGTALWMDTGDKEMLDVIRWPADIHDKYILALDAILTETDRQAQKNGNIAVRRHQQVRRERRVHLSVDDRKNIQWVSRFSWMHELEKRPEPLWGFVCFRTSFQDDAAWNHFQNQFTAAVDLSVGTLQSTEDRFWTPDCLQQRWKIQWVEDATLDNAALNDLCQYFRRFRDEGKMKPGLRCDAFLYANQDAIQSSLDHYPLPERGFVIAADPSYNPSKPLSYLYGFKGTVRVALTGVFTCFYARLIPRGDPEDDPTITRGMGQSWDVIYYKSTYTRIDKSYPPPSQNNRD